MLNLVLSLFACQGFFPVEIQSVVQRFGIRTFSQLLILLFFFFFQCRNQFFIGIVGKTFLEIYPVPVTFVCKEGECQFSVEGVKNVNMSELENFRHCLPTFCLCLHTTCLRQVWLFPHNHNRSPWCKFPSAFPLPPFLFSHWDVKMLQ